MKPLLLLALTFCATATQALASEWQPVPLAQAALIKSRLVGMLGDYTKTSPGCQLMIGIGFITMGARFQVINLEPTEAGPVSVTYFRRAGQPVLLVRDKTSTYKLKELLVSTDPSQRTITKVQLKVHDLVSTTDGPLTDPVRRERWETTEEASCN